MNPTGNSIVILVLLMISMTSCMNRPVNIDPMNLPSVVFMGNSITEHWPQYDKEFWSERSRINKGISGQVTGQMLDRFRTDVIDLDPSIVFILAGTNDIAGNMGDITVDAIFSNIKEMAEMAETSNIEVVLASVLPAADYPWMAGQDPLNRIPALNRLIRNYADENGIIYVDYFSAMVDDRGGMNADYAFDGVHPNAEGYAMMRPLTLNAIERALKKRK